MLSVSYICNVLLVVVGVACSPSPNTTSTGIVLAPGELEHLRLQGKAGDWRAAARLAHVLCTGGLGYSTEVAVECNFWNSREQELRARYIQSAQSEWLLASNCAASHDHRIAIAHYNAAVELMEFIVEENNPEWCRLNMDRAESLIRLGEVAMARRILAKVATTVEDSSQDVELIGRLRTLRAEAERSR